MPDFPFTAEMVEQLYATKDDVLSLGSIIIQEAHNRRPDLIGESQRQTVDEFVNSVVNAVACAVEGNEGASRSEEYDDLLAFETASAIARSQKFDLVALSLWDFALAYRNLWSAKRTYK